MDGKIDAENESAYMVHHVMNPKPNKNSKVKRLTRKRKRLQKKKGNGTDKPNVVTTKSNVVKVSLTEIKRTVFSHSKPDIQTVKKSSSPKNLKASPKRILSGQNSNVQASPKDLKVSPKGILSGRNSNVQTMNESSVSPKNLKTPQTENLAPSLKQKERFEKCFTEKRLFSWLIDPINVDEFIDNHWEKEPLHVSKRHSEFSLLLTTPIINNLLHYSNIIYTKNIDVTFYSNGEKELHNQEGVARPHVVWDFYCNKCSIRLLNPQTFVPNIHKLNSELQEYFGCFVGCNAYLTPPHSQGFAPHYDDIEAFILQIEGKKMWKVYAPRSGSQLLPRYSSCDFNEEEIGEPMMEVLLEEGDVLYLPRGYIHQACTQDSHHSLHITVSVYQCNAWIDLLEKVVPKAMENAWKNDIEFRRGLPFNYLNAAGFARNPDYKDMRSLVKNNIKQLIHKLADHVQIDTAVDQLGLKLMYDALPPVLTEEEKKCTVFEGGLSMTKKGQIKGADDFAFHGGIEIALLRQYVSRFVKEIEKNKKGKDKIVYRLYYTTDNSLEYHGETTSFFIIPKSSVKAVQTLFHRYPEYITLDELPHEIYEEKVNLVADLWERGIVRTKQPILQNV